MFCNWPIDSIHNHPTILELSRCPSFRSVMAFDSGFRGCDSSLTGGAALCPLSSA